MQSVFADLASVAFLGVAFYVNIHYIQSRLFTAIIVILYLLKIISYVGGRKNVFTDKAKAIEYLNS